MVDFVTALLELLFWPFDKVGSALFMCIFAVFLFCYSFALIRCIMRLFL